MIRIENRIFEVSNEKAFEELALEIFHFQAEENEVYAQYLSLMKIDTERIDSVEKIPFLPIELFRTKKIISGNTNHAVVFESSGTTSENSSRHFLVSENLYQRSFNTAFRIFYGDPQSYCILALLPSYIERGNSSLVYMMDHLIRLSGHPESGFYLNNLDELHHVLLKRNADGFPTILLGVSFALLDFADHYSMELSDHITVMETGGMKGRRPEMTGQELHQKIRDSLHCFNIHSEYGMTELLSQSYSGGNGIFRSPPWMKVLARDPYDPLSVLPIGSAGGINIIDLANLYSCSFIATGDLGKVYEDGTFEISGRFDQAEVRGCNLMVT
ncbi:MAG: acyltransferase [Bacteroidales bacterium]|nr:acyltransferase [Bacteroidales bacterium]